jgi:pilus assembly protein CpaC
MTLFCRTTLQLVICLSVVMPSLQARTLDNLADETVLQVTQSRSEVLKFKSPISRVSVADPLILDVIPIDPEQFILNGKARGATSLLLWDKNGQEGKILVRVNAANEELLDLVHMINNEYPSKSNVQTLITDDSVVFSGKANSTSQMDKIISAAKAFGYDEKKIIDLTEASNMQVSLKVRITEASREVVRNLQASVQYLTPQLALSKLGNNIDVARLGAALTGQAITGQQQQQTNVTNGIIPTVLGGRRAALPAILSSQTVGGLTTSYIPSWNRNLQFAFDFLETNGKLKTLAEPTLLVTHNQEAEFLAGGEIPFVSGTDRNGGPILSFKDYGVKLRFKPRIMADGNRLVMSVEPEVSTLDQTNCVQNNGQPVCGLLKRTTKTMVEMENNQTLFISGIISQEEQNFVQKIPYIGDLPIIGPLFRNKNTRKNERELLIVVTPTIVKKAG